MHHLDQCLLELSEGKIPVLDSVFMSEILEKTRQICQQDSDFEKTASLVAAELLLDKGADINTQDRDTKDTPIMKSIYCNNSDLFALFLSRGAKLDLVDAFGQTVLHIACSVGNLSIVQHLLATQKVDVSQKAEDNMLPLHYAIHHPDIISELLKSNSALINAQTTEGNTALHLAIQNTAPLDTLKILIAFHADFTIPNNQGQTPRVLARALNAFDSILFLMEQEFALNEKSISLREKDEQALAVIEQYKNDPFSAACAAVCHSVIQHTDYNENAKKELKIRSGK